MKIATPAASHPRRLPWLHPPRLRGDFGKPLQPHLARDTDLSMTEPTSPLPVGASVLWDLAMKRYDVYRGQYDALASRSVLFIAAAQGLIAAHAFALGKLSVLGKVSFSVCATISAMLYLGATVCGWLSNKTRNVNPLPIATDKELMGNVTLTRDVFVFWLVKHYIEPKVNAPLRRTYLLKERYYSLAMAFVMLQAAWLFAVTLIPFFMVKP